MYPEKVELNQKNIDALTRTFKTAYKKIVREIDTATDFGVANRKAILAQIDIILTDLGVNVDEFLKTELPKYYKSGADDAVKQLKDIGAPIPVKYGFNRVHKDAIAALVDDTSRAFGDSLTGVNRSARRLLGKAVREQITQDLAKGQIGGDALKKVQKVIKATLQEDGLAALVDKRGANWELDRYAEMLIRTKSVETRNRGLANRMSENGYDLVQVSSHAAPCPLCGPWEGQVLSLTGSTPGYPTVADAEADGLFHPNCEHAINALVPDLAEKTFAYDPDTETVTLGEDEIKAAMGE